MQGKPVGLAHIGVKTSDIEKSIQFYQGLGFTLGSRVDLGTKLAFLDCGACEIELIQSAEYNRAEGPVAHIAIEVQYIDDYVAAMQQAGLIPADVKIGTVENLLGGVKNCFFKGPSDEILELFDYYTRY